MTEPLGSIVDLLTDEQNLVLLILTIVILVYLHETIKYHRMFKKTGDNIHIAPISINGEISEMLGPDEAGLVLREQLFAITENFHRARSGHSMYYMDQALGADFLGLYSTSIKPAHSQVLAPPDIKVPEDLVLRAPGFTIPVGAIARFLSWVGRRVPIYHRNKYLASVIHVSLVSHGDEAQVHVYQMERSITSSPEMEELRSLLPNQQQPRKRLPSGQIQETDKFTKSPVLVETKRVTNYEELKDLLRDAAFFVLELHEKAFPGQKGRCIRCLADGLYALDEYRRTGNDEKLTQAKERFSQVEAAEVDDPSTLYFFGCLFLVDRTQESITMANKLFERALKASDNQELKALCHVGLANCIAQGIHRLARKKEDLREANIHIKWAKYYWKNKYPKEEYHPWIFVTTALLNHVYEGTDDTREETKDRFVTAAKMYYKALEMEPQNGTLHNNLGWVMMKLAQWKMKSFPLGKNDEIYSKLEGNPAETAEKYFNESIGINRNNKLTYANLCLLYATPHYRERKEEYKTHLERCRFYGEKAIQLDPNYINGHRDLALSLAWYGQFDEAYEYYKKALELSDNIKKDQELMCSAEKVLNDPDVNAQEVELERWLNPPPELLSPPNPGIVK